MFYEWSNFSDKWGVCISMIQVWLYDENKIYTMSTMVDELEENMTTISPISNGDIGTTPHRPRFDEENQVWVEDMTEEEIKALEEDNKIDILTPIKTTEELTKENEQLWDTVEYLLKQVDMIPEE